MKEILVTSLRILGFILAAYLIFGTVLVWQLPKNNQETAKENFKLVLLMPLIRIASVLLKK